MQYPALFAAFDIFPSTKGASVHIAHNAEILFAYKKGGILCALTAEATNTFELLQAGVALYRFSSSLPNYLQRAKAYSEHIYSFLATQKHLEIAHFRDIWSGMPILAHKAQSQSNYKVVYEVNGIMSIELPYRYPLLARSSICKLESFEKYCYDNSDYILTPSHTIRQNLIRLGASATKISVISNGADVPATALPPSPLAKPYILYFGALQSWQGVETLLKAFQSIAYLYDYQLVICSSVAEKQTRLLQKMVARYGLTEFVVWQYQLSQEALGAWVGNALFSVAPLRACSRNILQGCCPLKILESMAWATPVIASDLPAVREIIADSTLGKLVVPDRPQDLARAMQAWIENPQTVRVIGKNAQRHIAEHFTWTQKCAELEAFYQKISP